MAEERAFRILAGRLADARGERESVAITVEKGRIVELTALNQAFRPMANDVDARQCLALPGFLDIHVHGGAGRYVMEATEDALAHLSQHLACHGVTGFLSTTVTGPWELQAEAVAVAAKAMRSPQNGLLGAAVLGSHLEGPYINPRRKGAQPAEYILLPDIADLVQHVGDNLPTIRVVTLAPEMPDALEMIRFLCQNDIVASIGHTDATYEQVCEAIDAGARHVTHCFNAMRPMESREPGVVGAAFSRSELTAELIWDNIHVHNASCRALAYAKGAQGVILVSDGIPGAGMPEGYQFSLGDLPVVVHDGAARLPDGTLAGSLLTMERAFGHAGDFSLPQRSAMTSHNAAVALGLGHRKGRIAPGYDADLTLLAADGSVNQTFIAGRSVFKAAESM